MAVDAQAMAAPAPVESTADLTPALPAESTGAGDAVENPVAGDGTASEPTPEGESSAEAGSLEDDDDVAPPDETPEAKKTRSQRRQERLDQQIEQRVQAALSKDRSEREAKDRSTETTAAARAAELARVERLQQFIGVPDAPEKPGTLSTLSAEYDTFNQQIRNEVVNPTPGWDEDGTATSERILRDLTKKANEKTASIARLRENLAMAGEIEGVVWSRLGSDFSSAASFPELAADPAKQAAYLNAQGGVRGALNVLADTIRSAKDAEKATALKAQADKHAVELKALQTDRDGWRVRAGGAEGAVSTGGRPAPGGGALTYERYMAMSTEERLDLKPSERDAMMRNHLAARR